MLMQNQVAAETGDWRLAAQHLAGTGTGTGTGAGAGTGTGTRSGAATQVGASARSQVASHRSARTQHGLTRCPLMFAQWVELIDFSRPAACRTAGKYCATAAVVVVVVVGVVGSSSKHLSGRKRVTLSTWCAREQVCPLDLPHTTSRMRSPTSV